jgi:hypothetical protein
MASFFALNLLFSHIFHESRGNILNYVTVLTHISFSHIVLAANGDSLPFSLYLIIDITLGTIVYYSSFLHQYQFMNC